MKRSVKLYVAIMAFVTLLACSPIEAETETPATSDATACEYVTLDDTLDVERLTEGVKYIGISGNGYLFVITADKCGDLFAAIAETSLEQTIIPQPTPTPAPGHLLSISLKNEQGGSYYIITLKTNEEMWLSTNEIVKIQTGRSDENTIPYSERTIELERWVFIIDSEDGQRIHEIAKGLSENAD